MNSLILAAAGTLSVDALVHFFLVAAIIALIVWGLVALIKSAGWAIPQPVWIVLTVLVGIFLIVFIARLFGYAV